MRFLMSFLAGLFRRPQPVMREIFAEPERRRPPAPKRVPALKNPPPYKVFTREFDRIIDSSELDRYLDPVPVEYDYAYDLDWKKFQAALEGWRLKGALTAIDASADIRRNLSTAALADTAVVILFDQSGSMRGHHMVMTAAALDIAQDFLGQLGCTVELLGFTTATWDGGKSRQKWQRAGKPPNPGRLCDLLHIVYRHVDDRRQSMGGWSFKAMLHPGLLKENVDGEALEWAAGRLRALPKTRKILIVVSDGAPAEHSTFRANDAGILDRHLLRVVAHLEASSDLSLAAIGIGYDVARYYRQSVRVAKPDDLDATLIGLIQTALTRKSVPAASAHVGDVTIH